MFHKSYGIVYIGNNPVEKKLCIKIVKNASKSNAYLNYTRLRDMFGTLSESEQEYLTDYIIMSYFPFDKDRLLSYYEDWNQMVEAMHSTAGSEHDIKEVFSSGSDQIYDEMVRYIKDEKTENDSFQ